MADMASELEAAAVRLRNAGREDLARELAAGMRRGVEPVPGRIRDGLRPRLPDRYVEETFEPDLDVKTTVSPGSGSGDAFARVYARTRSGRARKLRSLDAGLLHHPLWGDREHWYRQPVGPGWFTGPAEDAAPQVRGELERALRDVAAKAEGNG